MARVMDWHDELQEHPIHGRDSGGGMQGSFRDARNIQLWMVKEAQKRGEQVERDLDGYISGKPDGLKLLRYSTISSAAFSGGTLFKLPFLKLSTEEGEMEFRLIHNNYEKAGKLEKDVYARYLETLKRAFGVNLKAVE